MDESLEPGSKVTFESDWQPLKQFWESFSTAEGMQTDASREQRENAELPMCESCETDSKVTVSRDSHSPKQFSLSCSVEEGITIDESGQYMNTFQYKKA
jgi:hypothetical protein